MAQSSHDPTSPTRDLAAGLVVALAAGGATWWVAGLSASYGAAVLASYGVMCGVVALRLPDGGPGPGVGAANRVTLFRGALAVPLFAMALRLVDVDGVGAWWVIVLSTAVLVLDGLDGRVARRTGTETAFGARFDMEVDAALLMALSVLVWADGRVGAWVLLIGAMRYLFIAAGWVWPALAAELPPSRRRKIVCVVQGVVLLVALGPVIPDWLAVASCAGGLAALTYSFAVDVRWALTARRGQREGTSSVADTG